MKRDYAFVEFSDPRDADDARYHLDGREVDGSRLIVEIAKGVLEVLENMWEGVRLLDLDGVSTAVLMATGLAIAKLAIGRINATDAGKVQEYYTLSYMSRPSVLFTFSFLRNFVVFSFCVPVLGQ